jgi:hypothetical protein
MAYNCPDLPSLHIIQLGNYCFENGEVRIESMQMNVYIVLDCANLEVIELGQFALECLVDEDQPGHSLSLRGRKMNEAK